MTSDPQSAFTAAVIGLGFIGAGDPVSGDAIGQQVADLDGTHAQSLGGNPHVRLIAGSSRDEGRRRRFEHRCAVDRTYADWREMLATEKPDIVSIATNSPHHADITMACAEAGVRAVLCEKPVSTRLRDADRAIASCHEHGTILVVNHNRRWHPLWCDVRDEIRNGAVGKVQHAVAHWSTGRLGNVGTHIFDALRMLLGVEAIGVSATLDPVVHPDCRGPRFHDPGGWGVIAFVGGVRAFINAPQESKCPFVVRVVGSEGQIAVRGNDAIVETWNGSTRTINPVEDAFNSIDRAVSDVVHCLTVGGQPASTGEDGLAALEIIIGFHASDRLCGQWVSLPIADDQRNLEVAIG